MEAKDTILTTSQKEKLFEPYPCLDPSFEEDYKSETALLLEGQAKRTWKPAYAEGKKAGIREVVEFCRQNQIPDTPEAHPYPGLVIISKERWQAKTKEWGVE